MYTKQTTVVNKSGLHARPAADFVRMAKSFESNITIRTVDPVRDAINAKFIVRLLAQSINPGDKVQISAEGSDEKAAVDQLIALVDSGFGE